MYLLCIYFQLFNMYYKAIGSLCLDFQSKFANKRPKMGLFRSPDIHWCHGQEYGLEDLVKKFDTSVLTSLY